MKKYQLSKLTVYCDGGARGNPGIAASAFVVLDGSKVIHYSSRFLGVETNNVAEYSAVNDALEWLLEKHSGKKEIKFYLDSELIVNQLSGKYKIKSPKLIPLAAKAKRLEKELQSDVSYNHVSRNKNKIADELVNKELDKFLSENKIN